MSMILPHRINLVGVMEYEPGYRTRPRAYSRAVRGMAGVLVGAILVVVLATTALSLGGYCLTSDAGDARQLPWGR